MPATLRASLFLLQLTNVLSFNAFNMGTPFLPLQYKINVYKITFKERLFKQKL